MKPLVHFVDVVDVLVRRNFKGQYKNTAVGMAWSVITPVLFLCTFYFLFKLVLVMPIHRYGSFTFTGIIAWGWFQASLNDASRAITSNTSMVSQPTFPVAALPVVSVLSSLINFLIAIPVLSILLYIEGSPLTWGLLLLPVICLVQMIFTMSVAFFLAASNVFIRDVQYILPVLLQIGYFATPIFYDVEQVPAEFRFIYDWNPMSVLISSYRSVLLHGQLPEFTPLVYLLLISVVAVGLTYSYFQVARLRFLEEL